MKKITAAVRAVLTHFTGDPSLFLHPSIGALDHSES